MSSETVEVGQLWWDSSQNKFVLVVGLEDTIGGCPWTIWRCKRFINIGILDRNERVYLTNGIFEHPYMKRIA